MKSLCFPRREKSSLAHICTANSMTPVQNGSPCYASSNKKSFVSLYDGNIYGKLIVLFEVLVGTERLEVAFVQVLKLINDNKEGVKYNSYHLRLSKKIILIKAFYIKERVILFPDLEVFEKKAHFFLQTTIMCSSLIPNSDILLHKD
jgi:hypothetical protein